MTEPVKRPTLKKDPAKVALTPETVTGLTPQQIQAAQEEIKQRKAAAANPQPAIAPEVEMQAAPPRPPVDPNVRVVRVRNGMLHIYKHGNLEFECGQAIDGNITVPSSGYAAEWCIGCQQVAENKVLVTAL